MQYSVLPISMTMFNQKLENCHSVQDVKDNFEFLPVGDTPIILTFFIKCTKYLIQSYEDLNFKNWGFFSKKIEQIFPADELKSPEWNLLQKNVLLKFRELYPQLAKAGTAVNEDTDSPIDIDSALVILDKILKKSSEKRLEEAFEIEKAVSLEDKAKVLQLSLNFLIVESDLIKHLSAFTEVSLKGLFLQAEMRQGSERVIQISASSAITLFEIPANLEDTDEFSFWLQLSSFINLSFDGSRLFASLNVTKNDVNFEQFKTFLYSLREKTSCKRIHFIIDKWFTTMDFEMYSDEFFNKKQSMSIFFKSVTSSRLSKCKYSERFEFEMTPISSYLFKILSKCIFSTIFHDSNRSLESDFQDFNTILEFWKIQKDNQRKLFEETNRKLWELIKNNLKFKSLFLQYTKDLTGPANCTPGNMREYPKVIEVLSSTETVEKKIITPKSSKAKFTSSPKKNLKKKTEKKISNLCQNIESSIENEKIKNEDGLPINTSSSGAGNELNCLSGKDEQTLDLPSKILLPGDSFPFKFDQRVQRWNNHHFGEPFLEKEFPEYYDKDLVYQKLMHLFHAPHHLVDRFLSFGIQGTWLNVQKNKNDLRYVVPAEITYNNKKHRGLIVYAIDSETNVCYHRFFTEKMDQDILFQITNKVFNENDYPDLRDAVNVGQSQLPKLNVVDSSSIKIESGHVEIVDFDRAIKIKLFKVKNV